MGVSSSYYLVFNLGFRSLRAVIFSSDGTVVLKASRTVDTIQFSEGVEQDPKQWLERLESLLQEVTGDPLILRGIKYVSFTGSAACLILTNLQGAPIGKCMLVSDRRAVKQAQRIASLPEFQKITAEGRLDCDSSQMFPKIVWAKENLDLPSGGTRFLSPNDFFCYYFTGKFLTDTFNAQKLYYDLRTKTYPKDLLEVLDVKIEELPAVVQPGTLVGPLLPVFYEKFHLPKDCEYVVTSYDAICGFWGSGPSDFSEACDVSGTVTSLRVLVEKTPASKISKELYYSPLSDSTGILGGSNNLGGGLVEWAKDLFFKDCDRPYEALEAAAKESLPGARGLIFLPYLMGERAPLWNSSARGVFFGIERFHHRGDYARAVLESAGFALYGLQKEIEVSGSRVTKIRSTGGMSRIKLVAEIKADITGCPVYLLDDFESSATGAFLYMGVASGIFSRLDLAAKSIIQPREVVYPNQKRHQEYQKIFSLYQLVYQRLCPAFDLRDRVFKELYQGKISEGFEF